MSTRGESGNESSNCKPYSRSSTGIGAANTRRSMSSMSTTSLSLSQPMNTFDINKPAVILDIGTELTKIGLAGDLSPRVIIRTEYIDEQLVLQKDVFSGVDEKDRSSLSRLLRFFKHIYYNHLLTMPRERRVVIVESLLCPTRLRRAISTVLLDLLESPSVLFAPSHLLATFPFNTNTALVIDMGYKETVIIPVAEGITMLSQWEAGNKGARAIIARLRQLLEKEGQVEDLDGSRRPLSKADWHVIEETRLLEDVLVRGLVVSSMSRADLIRSGQSPSPPTAPLILPMATDMLIVPGKIREEAAEIVFESTSPDDPGLHEMIHSIVERCPIDLRKRLFSRILPIGGVSLIPGLLSRLKAEIVRLAENRGLKTCDEVGFFTFQKAQMEPWMAWLGGSMLGSLTDTLQHRSVSREDWIQRRVLPDATDFIDPFDRKTNGKTRA